MLESIVLMVQATQALFQPWPLFLMCIGTLLGILIGALPGISTGMLITLTLPVTYYMAPENAVVLLIGMYIGGISGGLITATLFNMPGEVASIITTLDGYPMAKSGRPGRALGLGIFGSMVGGVLSWIALAAIARPLSVIGASLGQWEIFSLIVMAMVLISSISQGAMLKGLISATLGMLAAIPGVDPSSGLPRLTFGYYQLNSGFALIPVLMGVYVLSEIFQETWKKAAPIERISTSMKGVLLSFTDMRRHAFNMLRSSLIGIWVGILPGAGAAIGSLIAYTVAKNSSSKKEEFGHGSEEGIIASETSNNATVGGSLIPLISLGIPGSVIDAILIAALMMHSIQPGPLLFINHADVVYLIIMTALFANFVMFGFMILMSAPIARLTMINRAYITATVVMLCVLGAISANNNIFDVWVMLAFGLLGWGMVRAAMPLGPFMIGFVLLPMAEQNLRTGLMISGGDYWPLLTRPLSAAFLCVAAIMLFWPLLRGVNIRRLNRLG